jgi:hypothetical protein
MGTGPDAMEYPPLGIAYDTPVLPFILRLRNAIEAKAKVFAKYITDGLIKPDQATVIAVSGALLPTAIGEALVPRIVQATLGIGNPVLNIVPRTGEIVDRSVEDRREIQKHSGAAVSTDVFLNESYAHVSAILYSASCWVNHPEAPGCDFTLIHNDKANVPLPQGWFPIGDEYWRRGSQIGIEFNSVSFVKSVQSVWLLPSSSSHTKSGTCEKTSASA